LFIELTRGLLSRLVPNEDEAATSVQITAIQQQEVHVIGVVAIADIAITRVVGAEVSIVTPVVERSTVIDGYSTTIQQVELEVRHVNILLIFTIQVIEWGDDAILVGTLNIDDGNVLGNNGLGIPGEVSYRASASGQQLGLIDIDNYLMDGIIKRAGRRPKLRLHH